MAVTDLTDSLPYWARQGAGAGPTGGPGAAPQGSGNSQDWLNYLSQMYGITPQQAALMMQGSPMNQDQQEQQGPPDDGHGDGNNPPVSPQAGMHNFGNPPPANGPGPGNVGPVALTAQPQPRPIMAAQTQPPAPPGPPAASGGPPVGAGMLDQSGVQRGPMGVLRTQPGASAPVGAGLPDQSGVARSPAGVLTPGLNPNAPAAMRRLRLRPLLAHWRAAALAA